jgi:hypothetical protein
MATLATTGDHAADDQALGRGAERAAWTFYAIAALGSSIGQIWVGTDRPPWPDTAPLWLRALLVLPFAVVIDLGGVVCSAFADSRQRLGENAYGWRILSAASVTLAVGINVVGHFSSPYLAVVFGGLGVFAYAVWLLHTSARRRDALRASGKMAATPPAYGLWQWRREPGVTHRAKALAAQFGYGLHESLTEARSQLRAEARRAALASHIDKMIRARHEKDPVLASIAATTTPVDDVADALMSMIDIGGWARAIAAEIQPPETELPAQASPIQVRVAGRAAVLAQYSRPAPDPHPAAGVRPVAGDLAGHRRRHQPVNPGHRRAVRRVQPHRSAHPRRRPGRASRLARNPGRPPRRVRFQQRPPAAAGHLLRTSPRGWAPGLRRRRPPAWSAQDGCRRRSQKGHTMPEHPVRSRS